MAEQGYITRDVAEQTKLEPVATAPNGGTSVPAGYFVDAVRQQAERAGIPVMAGGYRVYTTLDPSLQQQAVTALIEGTSRVEAQKGYRHLTQAQDVGTHLLKEGSDDSLFFRQQRRQQVQRPNLAVVAAVGQFLSPRDRLLCLDGELPGAPGAVVGSVHASCAARYASARETRSIIRSYDSRAVWPNEKNP